MRCVTRSPSMIVGLARTTGAGSRLAKNGMPSPSSTGTSSTADLVEQAEVQALRSDVRPSHAHPLLHCYGLGLFQGARNAISDERGQRRVVARVPTLGASVADDEHRNADRMVAGPPVGVVEDPTPDHERAGMLDHLRQVRGACPCLCRYPYRTHRMPNCVHRDDRGPLLECG
jgi:hypothetical protein